MTFTTNFHHKQFKVLHQFVYSISYSNKLDMEVFIMKSTGIIRKVDELGRVVIPIELRRLYDIEVKDPIEIFTDENSIVLKKYQPRMACSITGEVSDKNMLLADGNIILSPKGVTLLGI